MAINYEPTVKPQTVASIFTKHIAKVIPLAFDESMSYYECICAFRDYLNTVIIPNVNNVNDGLAEIQYLFLDLQSAVNTEIENFENTVTNEINDFETEMNTNFNTLQDFVNNYFDNLDVQDEINNKLDEMLEDGVLEQIIEQYIQSSALWCFDNVSDMKLATNLINGSYAKTLGYYSKNDDGASLYKIRTKTNDDIIDEASIIALNDNTLVAELIFNSVMNVTQLGVHQNGTDDDSDNLQIAFNLANSKKFELVGNRDPINITKSIYIPAYVRCCNLHFRTSSPAVNFTNGYMIGINTSNMSTWDIQFPDTTQGYMKNCHIENTDQNNMINGIFNASNNLFENILFTKLNKSFQISSQYLDNVHMNNFQVAQKIGTDYALNLGFLGDACYLDTAHMYGTIGDKKFINIGSGHAGIVLSNIIANGSINVEYSTVTFKNVHAELSTETLFDIKNLANVTIEDSYLYHSDPTIKLTSSNLTLKNVLFVYDLKTNSYQNSNDIDINLTNDTAVLTTINSYKSLRVDGDAFKKCYSSILTNRDTMPSNKSIRVYNNNYAGKENNDNNYTSASLSVAYPNNSDYSKWYLESGTYYYKFVPLFDKERLISSTYEFHTSKALTNNDSGFSVSAINPYSWRVYRGTAENVYDHYVDIANIIGAFHDNGYFANGFKWKTRTAGDIDSFNTGFLSLYRTNGINITTSGFINTAPLYGSWKRGDIIFTYQGEGYPTGWICTADGTPGTWKEL